MTYRDKRAEVVSPPDNDINDLTRELDAAAEAIGVPSVPMKPPYSLKDMKEWALEVLGDGELSANGKVLAWELSLYVNRKQGSAYPGLDRIAKETKMAKKTIIAEREQLRARGHLRFDAGCPGYKTSARYWPRRWRVTGGHRGQRRFR
jgi:hypothetical protein